MTNQKMTLKGFRWDKVKDELDDTCIDLACEMPYSDLDNTAGMPVDLAAYSGMVNKFKRELRKPENDRLFKDIKFVTFSKASIFRILAQQDCEQIGFFFAIAKKEKALTLVLLGFGKDGKPVNNDLVDQVLANPESFDTSNNTTYPMVEEKGNGGTKPPLDGGTARENIVSLQKKFEAFIEKYNPVNEEIDIVKAMNEFVYPK